MKKTCLFGSYTWWNPIQYKKDYKKPYNQGNRTVSNQDFMVHVTKVFPFLKCTRPTALECWMANTLENWNSWTPLSQTLSSGVFRVLGWSYFFGRVILCGRQRDFLRPHFSTLPSILFWRGWSLQWQIVGGQDIRRTSLVFVGWFASPPNNMPLEIWMSFWLVVHAFVERKTMTISSKSISFGFMVVVSFKAAQRIWLPYLRVIQRWLRIDSRNPLWLFLMTL